MTRDRTEPRPVDDEPLGTTDPTWRDEQPAAEGADRREDDDERTIDADPAWLAQLSGDADAETPGAGDEDRTIDVDADLLEHVRAAARAARDGLAAPPAPAATGGEPTVEAMAETTEAPASAAPGTEPTVFEGSGSESTGATTSSQPASEGASSSGPTRGAADTWSPPAPGGPTSWLLAEAARSAEPPQSPAPPAEPTTPSAGVTPGIATRPPPPATAPSTPPALGPEVAISASAATPPAAGRWQPPARLRPAEVRPAAPLLADQGPTRRHLDWRWAALGIVLAVVVGFLIAIAVGGGDDTPDPAPGSTTVPGASTTVGTP